jgi:methyl-accepting chemotaxis protein
MVWLGHLDIVQAIARMDRSATAAEHAADGAREAAIATREAAKAANQAAQAASRSVDACFRLADEIRVMVERFISREGDRPQPGPGRIGLARNRR